MEAVVREELMKSAVHVHAHAKDSLDPQNGYVTFHLSGQGWNLERPRLERAWLLCSCLHSFPDHPSSA